jgi:N-acetylmuramoyl-L-alanine amidase
MARGRGTLGGIPKTQEAVCRMRAVIPLLALLAATLPAQTHPPNPRFTAPEGRPLAGLRICVDPGHGGQIWGGTRGYTGGTRSRVSSQSESEANLRVGLFLWDLLTQAGAEVVMTRTFETRLSADCLASPETEEYRANRREELNIRDRVAEANGCDVFVAIHHNAGGGAGANFSTAYFFDPDQTRAAEGEDAVEHSPEAVAESHALADAILNHLHERLGIDMRPARHGNYHVIRETSLPAVLVECAFMSNREQAEWMEDLAYSRLAAIGIFEGILEQFGHGAPAESAPTEEVQP